MVRQEWHELATPASGGAWHLSFLPSPSLAAGFLSDGGRIGPNWSMWHQRNGRDEYTSYAIMIFTRLWRLSSIPAWYIYMWYNMIIYIYIIDNFRQTCVKDRWGSLLHPCCSTAREIRRLCLRVGQRKGGKALNGLEPCGDDWLQVLITKTSHLL